MSSKIADALVGQPAPPPTPAAPPAPPVSELGAGGEPAIQPAPTTTPAEVRKVNPTAPQTPAATYVANTEAQQQGEQEYNDFLYKNDPEKYITIHPRDYLTRKVHEAVQHVVETAAARGIEQDPDFIKQKVAPLVKSLADATENVYTGGLTQPNPVGKTAGLYGAPIMPEGGFDLSDTASVQRLPEGAEVPKNLKSANPQPKLTSGKFESVGGIERKAPEVAENPNANSEVSAVAQRYNAEHGKSPINHTPQELPPQESRNVMADMYDAAKHEPNNPQVQQAYKAMKQETLAQFNYAKDNLGLKIDFTNKDPYKDAAEMQADVRNNHHLSVFTGGDIPKNHPLAEIEPSTGQSYNNIFRATHDLFGHAAGGHDFSEAGEENAYQAHKQMYSPEARPAVQAETQGQSNWFFNNKGVRAGAEPKEFAEQKATILPETVPKTTQDIVESAGGVYRGQNKDGLVEITLPRSATEKLPINDRLKDFVSVTIPEKELTPESVTAAMNRKYAEMGGKGEPAIAVTAPLTSPTKMHPALQKVSDLYHVGDVDDSIKYEPSIIRPDGKVIYLGQDWHPTAIGKTTDYASSEEGRTKFLNDTGAIRVRPNMDQREGETFHFTVPKDGVTPEQLNALRETAATLGHRGNLMFETADTPSLSKNNMARPEDWQMKGAHEIEPMLGKMGVLPDQKVDLSPAYGDTGKYVGNAKPERYDLGEIPISAATEDPNDLSRTYHHEAGHIVVGDAMGIPAVEVRGPQHPENANTPFGASAHFDYSSIPGLEYNNNTQTWTIDPNKVTKEHVDKIGPLLYGGAVADEQIHGIPISSNYGALADKRVFHLIADAAGLTPQEERIVREAAINQARDILTKGDTLDKIKKHSEDAKRNGMSPQIYMDQNQVNAMLKDIRGEKNEKPAETGGNGGTNGEGAGGINQQNEPRTEVRTAKTVGGQRQSKTEEKVEPWAAKAAADAKKNGGGFTVDPRTGETPTTGYQIEVGTEQRPKPLDHTATAQDIQSFYNKHKNLFDRHPELHVGGYGKELNISTTAPDLASAKAVAKKLDQISVWDNAKKEEIPTGGTSKQTKFPDYPLEQRLADLKSSIAKPTLTVSKPYSGAMDLSGKKNSREIVASDAAGKKLGSLELTHDPDTNIAHVSDVEVSPEFQKQGIGTSLYQKAADIAKESGATELRSNPGGVTTPEAHKVWNKLGARTEGNERVLPLSVAPDKLGSPISTVPLIKNPLPIKGTNKGGEVGTLDVAKALNKFTKNAAGRAELNKVEPAEMVNRAKDAILDEARYQLAQNNAGETWYTKDIGEHDKILQEMRPELADPAKLSLFKMVEAVLSSGYKPYTNFKSAVKAWDTYQDTGKFPPTNPDTGKSWGPRGIMAYGNAIDAVNRLISEKGEQGASDWLLSKHPIKDLREYNKNVGGKANDEQFGTSILGPKRGPFAQNLHGIESEFTADMWVARTWNRLMGTMEFDPESGEITTDTPRNSTERNLMKQSFESAAKELGKSTSAMQAIMWYYEQALYRAHGLPTESWSFSDAAKRAQEEEKYGTSTIRSSDKESKHGGQSRLNFEKPEPNVEDLSPGLQALLKHGSSYGR